MTLEKLIEMSADEWDKLSDEDLLEWSKQFHHITRPDKVIRVEKKTPAKIRDNRRDSLVQEALKVASQLGLRIK